ncbi:hypothetical protein [Chitinilyticum litopenaei]|uniref:hypothetical protein n=1 Tax=Chitinilyticum litopenaei TaxID=1121276 RepID=UPI0004921888|nr:hypothetical protein [Chitinilyticum litopenaei]
MQTDFMQAFLNHDPIEGLEFEHNDYVLIVNGVHAGKLGSLVMVLELLPEPKFIVELESGFDVEVLQSELRLAHSR